MSDFLKEPKIDDVPRVFTTNELVPFWEKIVAAIKTAPNFEEYQAEMNEQDSREARYIAGESGRENLDEKTDSEPNVVIFPDFETLLAAFSANEILSRLLPEEQLRELIEHERAHLEEAKNHGYDTEIGLSVSLTPNGYAFSPFVSVSVDSARIDEDDVRKHMKDIAGAPKSDVSESDKKKL